mgnify:CR=1 FL=1
MTAKRLVSLASRVTRVLLGVVQSLLAAAKVGGIHANFTYPVDFLLRNLRIETNIIEAACKALHDGATHYTSPAGILPLREAIARSDGHGYLGLAETVLMLTKGMAYWADQEAVREAAQDRPQPSPEDKTVYRGAVSGGTDNRYAPGPSGYGHAPSGRAPYW